MFYKVIANIFIQLCYFESSLQGIQFQFCQYLGYLMPLYFVIFPQIDIITPTYFRDFGSLFQLYASEFIELLQNSGIHEYLILLLNLLCLFLFSILIILNWKKKLVFQQRASLDQHTHVQITNLFIYVCFYCSKLLQQPLLCVVLANIVTSLKENSIGWLISDIFFALWMHTIVIMYNTFFDCNLQVTATHIKKINRSIFDQISAIILMMQTYIYVLMEQDAQYFQSIIFLILSLVKYYEIFFLKVYSSQQQIKMLLIIYSSGFFISLLNLLQVQQPLTQYLLMEPILYNISIKQWDSYFSNLFLRPVTKLSNEELNLMLIICFNDPELNQTQKLAFNAVEFSIHRRHCIKKDSCAQKYFTNDPTLLNFIQDDVLKEIQIRYLNEIKNKKINGFFSEFYYLCHFISAYQILGSSQEVSEKLEQKFSFNIINKIRWKAFKQIIKQNQYKAFAEKLQNESKDTIDLSGRINAFIKSESFNQQIKDDLVRIIEKRILFLGNLLTLNGNKILTESIKQIDMLEKQEKILENLYENFQSSKNRSVLMFFYAEILNDWYKAYDQTTINPVDIQFQQNSQEINFNSNKMNYMTFLFNNRQLRMISFSKQAPSLFGYTFSEFKKIDEPNILIPNGVREYHNQLVEHFLDIGEGKYLRKKGFNIIKHSSGYVVAVQFFYDFYYDFDHHLRFISFFQQMQYQLAILVMDKNQNIQGLSKELLKLLNYKVNFINKCDVERVFYNLPSNLFITEPLNQFQDRVILSFPNEQRAKQMMNLTYQQKLNFLQHRSRLNCYEMQCDVINESNYTIIKVYRILDADNVKSFIRIESSSQNLDFPPMFVNDEETVIFPYDDISAIQSPKQFESIQIIQTTRNNISSPFIKSPPKPIEDFIVDESEKDHNSEQLTVKMLGDVYHEEEDQISGVQNEAQSCASSMAGIRRSNYFKKYLLYNKLNSPKFLGRWINYIICLLIISMLIQFTFLFIILSFTIQDYSKIQYFYQSIQINHYFIEPLQKFFLTRYTLQDYLILGFYGEMNKTEQTFLSAFTKPNLIQQFDNLKVNFQDHFGDPSLQMFFVDKYLQIKQQIKHTTPIKLQVYNMTLVNAFSILLEAFYSQYRIYVYPKSISGVSSYNTYQYVNYMVFVTVFDDISNEIYVESNNQISYTINKWIYLIFPIVIVNMFILGLFIVYSLKYIKQLENILKITRFCEEKNVQRDLKRLKFLAQNLKTNSELLHKYKFNLEAKEKFIVNEQYVDQKQEHFTKNEKGKPQQLLRLSKSLLIVSFLFLALQHFFITIFTTKINLNYQDKFPQTIQLFKAISDLGVYVPAAYSQKEILYFWSYFSYYTNQDRLEYIDQIEEAIQEIQTYLALGLSNQEYQFSTEYFNFYQQQDQGNLCQLFDPEKYVNFDYFCNNSKDGLLRLGLRATLTEFTNQLKNEKEMNFSNRTVIPRMEMEAVYFCSDAISILTKQMSDDINVQSFTVKLNLIIIFLLSTIFTLILLYLIVDTYKNYLGQQLSRTKKLAFLLPQETIFLNDHFERDLRMIAVKEQYI